MLRLKMNVKGIVQGVGFRPFVYNLAQRLGLSGWVLNNSRGVEIEVQGQEAEITEFCRSLAQDAPALAVIDEITSQSCSCQTETGFVIKFSEEQAERQAWVSPDVAICADCLQDMRNPSDRRYGYAFTNCTNCGPRYSIIQDVPYDRKATTMKAFLMCADCRREYEEPADRRFHAQPNACPECGPAYRLLGPAGEMMASDVFITVQKLIAAGHIIAIKGIGGYHLACDARQEEAVARLRRRKVREDKPFAVMGGSLQALRNICQISAAEEKALTSPGRPIVLLAKETGYALGNSVAPGNPYLGAMLPYAPAHWLLLNPGDIWVMTSANVSDEPIVYRDEEALTRLSGIADYFLVHNREIHRPADDSVVRLLGDNMYFLRRSRGYAPAPLKLQKELPPLLAAGGELKNTFCLNKGAFVFMSPHIGDLENMETYQAYQGAIEHYKNLFAAVPAAVAYDLHPGYLSTQYAEKLEIPKIAVQHHHAHIASVLAEHGLFEEQVIGVAFDGTGYGTDGKLWGGEFFTADCKSFTRAAHFAYLPLPGGAKAIKQPWRMAAWVLYNLYGLDFSLWPGKITETLPAGWQLMLQAAEQGLNAPQSSSVGRLFDAAAALLGICPSINYEGQAAVELELAAWRSREKQVLPYKMHGDKPYVLDFMPVFAAMATGLRQGEAPETLAAAFHTTLAHATVDIVQRLAGDSGLTKVALSGGVWQNKLLLEEVVRQLQQTKLTVYINQQVPCNDGGLALGQIAVAGAHIK